MGVLDISDCMDILCSGGHCSLVREMRKETASQTVHRIAKGRPSLAFVKR
jgi:hypothetical protein